MPHRPSPSSPSPRRGRPLRGLRGLVAAGGVVLLLGSAVQPAAAAGGASADVLDLGAVMNQMAGPASSGPHAQAKLSLPVWGNWCGPGHGGGTPIDVLDSICRTHDRCYGARGYFACSCDREIVKNIRASVHRMGSRESLVAAAVATYFTYCLCNPLK